jgi:tetratricopeptide (TPR) repeat protein
MKFRAVFAVFATALATASFGQKLGDPIGSFKPAKWIQGSPVTDLHKGIHVLEFWAETSEASKASLPLLAKLSRDYKGRASFVAIAVPELESDVNNVKYAGRVSAYIKGAKISLPVAIDQANAATGKAWLIPAEVPSLPAAFVVKDGIVQWVGLPGGVPQVLKEVVAGTWSVAKAKEQQADAERKYMEFQARLEPLYKAMEAHDERLIVGEMDKLFVTDPWLEQGWGIRKFENLIVFDEPKAYEYAQKLAGGLYKNEPEMLNNMAWEIVNDENSLKTPDYKLAIKLAEQSVALSKEKDSYSLDTLAYAYYKSGDKAKGVQTQEKAVKLAEKDKEMDKETLGDMKRRLDIMRKKVSGQI